MSAGDVGIASTGAPIKGPEEVVSVGEPQHFGVIADHLSLQEALFGLPSVLAVRVSLPFDQKSRLQFVADFE